MGPLGASVRALRPRCGHPGVDFVAEAKRTSRYAAISKALLVSGVPPARCREQQLSQLVCDLRWFIDRRFGRFADPARRMALTVLPAAVFRDFSEFGALHTALRALFRYAQQHNIEEFGFDDPEREEECERVVQEVYNALKQEHRLRAKRVFITPLVEKEEADSLRGVLQRHGAAIVSLSSVATHIIYPDPNGTREHQTDGQVLVRVLERAEFDGEELCFLHWHHHPDSYDDWVPGKEVLGHVFKPRTRNEQDPWHVQARWVRDLELHNEFMNELDYEMPPTFSDLLPRSPTIPVSEANDKPFSNLLRLRLRMPKPEEITEQASKKQDGDKTGSQSGVDMQTKTNGKVHDSDGDLEMTEVDGMSGEEANGTQDEEGQSAPKASPDEQDERDQEKEKGKIALGNGAFLPSFTKWFKLDSVHDIEKRALLEFFDGKFPAKTEDSYVKIRNYMVETWRKSPNKYLSATVARKNLSGDACSILRVHGFLEHWGLINYDSSIQGAPFPSFAPPPRPLPLHAGIERDDAVRASKQLVLDSANKAQVKSASVVKFGRNGEVQSSGRSEAVVIRDTDVSKNGRSASIAETPAREPIEYHCDSCGTDCSQLRFHCATKADVDLCAKCYQDAKYSTDMKPRDFIQMNSAGVQSNSDDEDADMWTESETLLLLEALEMYGANWTLVSEHVGSKGKSQCVIQFLRLPIEDAFLTTTVQKWWTVRPKGGVENLSPLELLRKAGARETALAALTGISSGSKSFTGQPIIYGDQISTMAPFAGMLSSLAPLEIMNEVSSVMGVSSSRKRRKDSFMALAGLANPKGNHREPNGFRHKALDEVADDDLLTSRVYDDIRQRIPTPSMILKTEKGDQIARGALSLINHGAIPVLEIPKMQVSTSVQTLLQLADECLDREKLPNGVTKHAPSAPPPGLGKITVNGNEVDSPSASAVAVACLSTACISASSRQQLEESEIDRLHSLACEARLARIRRKMQVLEGMVEHERFASSYKKRRRSHEIVDMVKRATGMIHGGMEEVLQEGGPAWVWGSPNDSVPVCRPGIDGLVDGTAVMTASNGLEGHNSESARQPLPDFSKELVLQRIKGVRVDGEVIEEDEEVVDGGPPPPSQEEPDAVMTG